MLSPRPFRLRLVSSPGTAPERRSGSIVTLGVGERVRPLGKDGLLLSWALHSRSNCRAASASGPHLGLREDVRGLLSALDAQSGDKPPRQRAPGCHGHEVRPLILLWYFCTWTGPFRWVSTTADVELPFQIATANVSNGQVSGPCL